MHNLHTLTVALLTTFTGFIAAGIVVVLGLTAGNVAPLF